MTVEDISTSAKLLPKPLVGGVGAVDTTAAEGKSSSAVLTGTFDIGSNCTRVHAESDLWRLTRPERVTRCFCSPKVSFLLRP